MKTRSMTVAGVIGVACYGAYFAGEHGGYSKGYQSGVRDGFTSGRVGMTDYEKSLEWIRKANRNGHEIGLAEGRRQATEELSPRIDELTRELDTQAKQAKQELRLAVERAWEAARRQFVQRQAAAREEGERQLEQAQTVQPAEGRDKLRGNLHRKSLREQRAR